MSRPWIKLATAIYRHPELGLLSDSAWRRFVECVALAGDVDDEGRLGTWIGVARQLYVSEDQLRTDVAELAGRIEFRDGQLYVRDWSDHQPASRRPEPTAQVTARQKSRRRHADVTQTSRKRDNRVSRNGHAPLEVEVEEETEGELPTNELREPTVVAERDVENGAAKSARPDQLAFEVLVRWRGLAQGKLTGNVRGRLNKLGADLRAAGYGPVDLTDAERRWWLEHWKGQRGSPPSYAEIEEWVSRCAVGPELSRPAVSF